MLSTSDGLPVAKIARLGLPQACHHADLRPPVFQSIEPVLEFLGLAQSEPECVVSFWIHVSSRQI